ncbi:hypothetical protein [Petroclostridium sp. X23]|uniref:hypothetical protein n=1 Tax=Petroclostridium sp. X23 TaxID=3045146 RepID=UPI0024AD7CB6|nr:hypothetical protein [Petroclostridium sp. X23]WHH56889.1 hypothetical protein QKW49_13615 [Petroclostridium sp. X23]
MKTINIRDIRRKLKKRLIDVDKLQEMLECLLERQQVNYAIKGLVGISLEYVALLDILNQPRNRPVLEQEYEVEQDIIFIRDLLNRIDTWFIADEREKDDRIKRLKAIKKMMLERAKVLAAYQNVLEVYIYILTSASEKSYFEQQELQQVNMECFVEEVIKFIFSQKEKLIVNEKLKAILRCLPIKISKQRFYDYIVSSIGNYKGAYTKDLEAFIEMLMDTFYPERIKHYGETFKFIVKPIENMRNIDFSNLSQHQVDEKGEEIQNIADDINLMINLCNYTTGIVNKAIAMIEKTCVADYEVLWQEEPALESVSEMMGIIKEMIKETVYDFTMSNEIITKLVRLEGKQEKWMDRIERYMDVINYAADEYKDTISDLGLREDIDNIRMIELFNSDCLFVDPDIYIHNYEGCEQVDTMVANNKAQSLIDFIEEKSKSTPPNITKVKMNILLFLMPPAFNTVQEVTQYVTNAMKSCSDRYEKLAVIDAIRQIMDNYGYKPFN